MTSTLLTSAEHDESATRRDSSAGSQVRRVLRAMAGGRSLLWIILSLVLILPTLAFLIQGFFPALFGANSGQSFLANLRLAFSGPILRAIINSLVVSILSALFATGVATILAFITTRTSVLLRKFWPILMWASLLVPTYLVTEGWQRLLEPHGILYLLGFTSPAFYHIFFGPFGVVLVLTTTGIPFAYLLITAGFLGLGSEFEDAARVHGASFRTSLRIVLPMLAPALLSAFAIVFAESMSDFGVASTLAASANFPIATYSLYGAINSMPLNFGVAADIAWLLVASTSLPIILQSRALKGKSYQVISGRSRPVKIRHLTKSGQVGALATLLGYLVIALAVPALGVISASLIGNFGTSYALHSLTFSNYTRILSSPNLAQPLTTSTSLSLLTAVLSVSIGVFLARAMTSNKGKLSGRIIDFTLLSSVALPSIVLAAGYIFLYNLPQMSSLGINIYGTSKLLALGYLAGALPTTARLLFAPVSQVKANLNDASRVHGAGSIRAFLTCELPLLSQPMLWGFLLAFSKTLLELPLSQLLYAPGYPPISVAINRLTAGYDFGGGTAMSVIALLLSFAVIITALGLYRFFAPAGWRRVGGFNITGVDSHGEQ